MAPLTGRARIVAFGQSTPPAYDQIQLWRDYYADHVGHDGVAERVWRRSEVRTRHLTASPVHEDVCRWSTAQRMRRFLDDALPLAKEAVGSALVAAPLIPEEVGLLATVSCTGYANPGLDVHLAKDLGMRSAVRRLAVGHMGCYAAIPGLAVASDYVIAQRRPAVLVCTELPSLHVQPPPHDTQQAVAHALFADACAAVVLAPSQIVGEGLDVIAVETLTDVGSTADMTWDITDHGFRMTLSSRVPALVARNVPTLVDRLLTDRGLTPDDVRHWAIHPGRSANHRQGTGGLFPGRRSDQAIPRHPVPLWELLFGDHLADPRVDVPCSHRRLCAGYRFRPRPNGHRRTSPRCGVSIQSR